jgi:hypothetical protein
MDQITERYAERMQVDSPLLGRVVESIDRFSTRDLEQLAGLITLVVFDRHQLEPAGREG